MTDSSLPAEADPGVASLRWEHSAGAHAVDLDGQAVIYDAVGGRLHVLNSSATVIWWSLDGSTSGGELAADLAVAFGVDGDTMMTHVLDVLATLSSEGLIRQRRERGRPGRPRPDQAPTRRRPRSR